MIDNNFFNKQDVSDDIKKVLLETKKLLSKDCIKTLKVTVVFEYIQKAEDKIWSRNNRNYYIHNVPLEDLSQDSQVKDNVMIDKYSNTEKQAIRNYLLKYCLKILKSCTNSQRRRFLLYNYYGMSLTEIAEKENVSINAIKKSLKSVEQKLNY